MRTLLLVSLVLSACGHVDHSGKVTVSHEISIDRVMASFQRICMEENAPDVEKCSADYFDRLMTLVGKAGR